MTIILELTSQTDSRLPDYTLAHTILGKNFISPEKVAKSRKGIVYTNEQLAQFNNTLPTQDILEWCRDNGYIVVAGPNSSMSLLEIRDLRSSYFHLKKGGWYAEQAFAWNDKVDTRWIMLCKKPIPESTSKNWNEQQALLSYNEITPNAAELIWCITTYKAVLNAYLLSSINARTSSLNSDGGHVNVGFFGAGGLVISSDWGGRRNKNLGVSACGKF